MQEARRLGVTPDDKIATLLQLGPELEGLYGARIYTYRLEVF